MGAVLHTLNIRLFEDDLRYVVDHADDEVIFLDASLAGAMPRFEGVEREIVMPDGPGERDGALDYEELVAGGDPTFEFPELEENTAAAMCYTSGTTGQPKGILYSTARSCSTRWGRLPDSMDIREADGDADRADVPRDGVGIPTWRPWWVRARCSRGPIPAPELTDLIEAEGSTISAAAFPTILEQRPRVPPRPARSLRSEGRSTTVPSRSCRRSGALHARRVPGWASTRSRFTGAATSRLPRHRPDLDELPLRAHIGPSTSRSSSSGSIRMRRRAPCGHRSLRAYYEAEREVHRRRLAAEQGRRRGRARL